VRQTVHQSTTSAPRAGVFFGIRAELAALAKDVARAEAKQAAEAAKLIEDTKSRQAGMRPIYEEMRAKKRERILAAVEQRGPATTKTLSTATGYDVSCLRKHLVAMMDDGLVVCSGSRARSLWRLHNA
jgi:predicted HTH transcriptional regulator